MITIRLLEPVNVIKNKILKTLAKEIDIAFSRSASKIETKIKRITGSFFRNSDIYKELNDGILAAHFGFERGTGNRRADTIVDAMVEGIRVTKTKVRQFGNSFTGRLIVGIVQEDLTSVLNKIDSIVVTEKGEILPWVEWLLIRGNEIIIADYAIKFVSGGRSGSAIMVSNDAGFWKVPVQYSGTLNDNWFTRSILNQQNNYSSVIGVIIKEELERVV